MNTFPSIKKSSLGLSSNPPAVPRPYNVHAAGSTGSSAAGQFSAALGAVGRRRPAQR